MNFQLTAEQGTKVLVNGIAKSGTHLLKKIVSLAGYQQHPFCLGAAHANRAVVAFSEEHESVLGPGIEIGAADPTPIHELLLRQLIRAMPPGFVFNGHCAFDPALARLLSEEKVKIIGILRDPRDIALSLVRYLIKHQHPVVQEQSEEYLLHCGAGWAGAQSQSQGAAQDHAQPGRVLRGISALDGLSGYAHCKVRRPGGC